MQINVRSAIAILRVTALIVMMFTVVGLWHVMLWLPWELDIIVAVVASLAFAYRFERAAEP